MTLNFKPKALQAVLKRNYQHLYINSTLEDAVQIGVPK